MSASHFGTTYWLDDYFGPYFQPEGQGGAIVGVLAGSAAGQATVAATLSSAQLSQSGVRRLGSYRAHTWNADRISAMLGSVRLLMGHVEKEAEKPKAEQAKKIEVPQELIEVAAIVAPPKPATPAIDFIPARVSLADLDASRLLSELRLIEARLERLDRRVSDPIRRPRLNVIKPDADEDDAALILLGMPTPKRQGNGITIDDDDLAALLLAA